MTSHENLSSTIALLDALTTTVYNNTYINNYILQEKANFLFSPSKNNVPLYLHDKKDDVLVKNLKVIGSCRICKKTFLKHIDMIHHIVDHYPKQFYSFDITKATTTLMDNDSCQNHFNNKKIIYKKERILRNKNKFLLNYEDLISDLGYAMCSICYQTFNTNYEYQNHINHHLMMINSIKTSQTNKIPYNIPLDDNLFTLNNFLTNSTKKCTKCNQHFYSSFDHNLHMGQHKKYSYDCKDCGKCFETRKKLSLHNKNHKNEILP
ncbi:Zinc finger, C2H2 domain and Zinc finger C2H2-type/integrase DNA-binding domain and Zinc finger,C2H2-like domain-containing protein [Strongyloides ratti]|uniref:Zinc finger, C2H2 domain and Zinc finger C2H2-type/integrase DNA-binding domain and Zinc finger,C2H2-like domain-containing protein n=1 Tax=Strongyloides ratti TaxID=34506 RepID=A0A090MMX7_STRRB|nr:Zinc finger, C2H2 domain and Zinc finger C2H2-type/integrase DNA-binding domain and Zinc finger,C2H2-like domain-containing protein [Strongyloides ratti]CEF59391.1 Zinc finger, C2H2 domain and Zinc finger C2H2-type/integrase DNA-binding domain and Zinc finger,C2H2-like domain-containing protein [Strongyloides ratti]